MHVLDESEINLDDGFHLVRADYKAFVGAT